MKPEAILFVDIDDAKIKRYACREPHFVAAREMGLVCLTAAIAGRQNVERLIDDSDELFFLEGLSVQALSELVQEINNRYRLRAVFCFSGHASALGQVGCIVAETCRQFGLPHATAEAINACNNKFVMRSLLQQKGIRSVRHAICNSLEELNTAAGEIGFPLIAKPPFGAASAFIKKCKNLGELSAHYLSFCSDYAKAYAADFFGAARDSLTDDKSAHAHQPGKSILLEEYVAGIEGSVECVLTEHHIYPLIINEKLILTEKSNTVVEDLLISPPSSFSAPEQASIRAYASECLAAIGLTNAIVHFEFRMTPEGPVVIEINPRLGGLYVNAAFKEMLKLDPYKTYLEILIRDPVIEDRLENAFEESKKLTTSYSMLSIYPEKSGQFKGMRNFHTLDENTCVLQYEQYPVDTYVYADIEEYYLLKCWMKVGNALHARQLYDEIRERVTPVIEG